MNTFSSVPLKSTIIHFLDTFTKQSQLQGSYKWHLNYNLRSSAVKRQIQAMGPSGSYNHFQELIKIKFRRNEKECNRLCVTGFVRCWESAQVQSCLVTCWDHGLKLRAAEAAHDQSALPQLSVECVRACVCIYTCLLVCFLFIFCYRAFI